MKETIIDFFSNLISVILGIVITFAVQGMIDRAHDRQEVRSALELVRTELISNREDIAVVSDYLEQELVSARYLLDHAGALNVCPADTVRYHLGIVHADVSIALPHDAQELLKMSSLFPKIGDNALSMKIIRAYDSCQLMVENINRHVLARDAQAGDLPQWLLDHDARHFTDAADIDQAITAINVFLRRK